MIRLSPSIAAVACTAAASTSRLRISRLVADRLLLLPLLAALMVLTGCGGYTLHGRVVRAGYTGIVVVDESDPRLVGSGISGVSVSVVRDAGRLSREQVASTISDNDGYFALTIDVLGAGITDEEWLIRAGRRGIAPVESSIRLPASPGKRRLLILTASGPSDAPGFVDPAPVLSPGEEIRQQIDQFR